MSKFVAIILWPYVYFLDFCIALTSNQTFKESRAKSNRYFNKILARDKKSENFTKSIVDNRFGLLD